MIYPSLFRLPEGEELHIQDLGGGAYAVTNAYQGEYDYFREPIFIPKGENSCQSPH